MEWQDVLPALLKADFFTLPAASGIRDPSLSALFCRERRASTAPVEKAMRQELQIGLMLGMEVARSTLGSVHDSSKFQLIV